MWLAFFSMMWSIHLLPKLLAKWPAFFRERPQLPGSHCRDVHWSMAGTAVLCLFTGRLEKRAFLASEGEGRGYQWTEVNIQRKLGLPPYFVGLPGVSDFRLFASWRLKVTGRSQGILVPRLWQEKVLNRCFHSLRLLGLKTYKKVFCWPTLLRLHITHRLSFLHCPKKRAPLYNITAL